MAGNDRNIATAASSLQNQEARSSMQMQVKTKNPKSKRVNQFNGFGGDKPLNAPASRQNATFSTSAERQHRGSDAHPWLHYPPRFESSVEKITVKLKDTLAPTGVLRALPAELRYSLTRNFGFFTRVFTQFFERDGADNVKQSIGLK